MAFDVYWLPRSEWKMAPPAMKPRPQADARAAIGSSAVILSEKDRPTTILVARSITVAIYSQPSSVHR
jgi:hypothetical protein